METKQREALIISGGPEKDLSYITSFLSAHPNIFIACSDSGILKAERIGIDTNLLVGDFDSSTKTEYDCEIIRLNTKKNDTDTMHTLQLLIQRGYESIWIVNGTGGRLDHFLCNLSLCEYAWKNGCVCKILNSKNQVEFLNSGYIEFQKNPNYKYFSIIPIDEELRGVTIAGAKYNLKNAVVSRAEIYTISNEIESDKASITIVSGRAWLIQSTD